MAPARRHVPPPSLVCSQRTELDPTATPTVDAALKQLKTCSRRLQAALTCHRTELQVLERLYYKGKNQHRAALFWQRVVEMRRLDGRVDEMHMDEAVESLRLAFWGDPSSRTTKLLKGPWTHCPDAPALLFVMERCAACCTLIDRTRERLLHAYESFMLMMQTGAFLQLVLTLAAIASRLSLLLTEVRPALEASWLACFRVLQILFPAKAIKVRPLVKPDPAVPAPPLPVGAPAPTTSKPPDVDSGPDDPQDEDTGSALSRAPQLTAVPEENVRAFDADAFAHSLPAGQPPPVEMSFSLSSELSQVRPIASPVPQSSNTVPSEGTSAASATNAPKRKKAGGEGPSSKPVKKKKKKRDEIDDIFGF
ncbi:hypothetical protein C8Q79DRAFT_1009134 [Trametes meyenii]|nr:hypothetical protein C8Q79DRAFT_1009134 [Trametes meyenii]